MKSQDFDIQEIIEQIVQFTKDREWDQFCDRAIVEKPR